MYRVLIQGFLGGAVDAFLFQDDMRLCDVTEREVQPLAAGDDKQFSVLGYEC